MESRTTKTKRRGNEIDSGNSVAEPVVGPDGCALQPGAVACDVCGAAMKPMGHCKYWCLRCGFLRTCNDTM